MTAEHNISVADLVGSGTESLSAAGVPSPGVDAELLVAHVLELSRGELRVRLVTGALVSAAAEATVRELFVRRAAREPLQHITGIAPFRNLELRVGPGVFVPRPETETVVQFAIDALNASATPEPIGVDLGTGSGAIALSMATEVPRARIYAVELSPDAIPYTSENFRRYGTDNATLINADLGDAFPELDGTVDVVISNPPYIPAAAIPRDIEVQLHDPALALYGGEDGMDVVRRVSTTARRLLHQGGTLVLEHGEEQAPALAALLTADGWNAVAHHKDLLGRDRATTALL
ncbi:peptide chain release factor N(5)-glutamine methyltransferase [Salinibacterium sp. NSLL150]|uniref:peptide chain release factor N(5)-glutamine methyltransferase n=1 Tax=unclassified Salinibacterium TaxID=2632331 RepID=UPI0018CEEF0A|nr:MULTISPECIES: peptide chain release factor N(5)-glutamine methyltransferase [unclassified Salinibacterium]MBH0100198.1 peptide chain release factor N(5)-glutamine methyltransferase [Salinibacterium sp. NSLL35]MBH0102952.1 peptide chain release factor N(5)-glutamine methyltransferase [Salinibacterium sp. NSLL150]MBH0105712.1 peptide chain release factor N(5)-glutamine methyltransferase [Salinibacterium sp. NSLL16]MBH0108472.1 peptide chain release factor N(5)-glutamine methyltransferase [Sali